MKTDNYLAQIYDRVSKLDVDMVQDVPGKSQDSEDLGQIEDVQKILDMEEEVDEILNHDPDNKDASQNNEVRTVATNTTR